MIFINPALIIEPKAIEVKIIEDHAIWTLLEDGREIIVPIAWYPRLFRATKQELNNFRIIGRGSGIHWEDLDEDLSIGGDICIYLFYCKFNFISKSGLSSPHRFRSLSHAIVYLFSAK